MAKINQIQIALKELDGGAFQKLADSYLLRKGYTQINPIGSVAGSNKVRQGTPDTLIPDNDEKYIFSEYTTIHEDKVFSKFSEDITKCLDENKTGISINKIKEIVLCCTSELSVEEINKLRVQCEKVKVNLNMFGLGAISYDLLEKYPSVAKDYLGVEVDTGQIVSLNDFISHYEKNKLATTLQTEFHFRKNEKNNLLSLIKNNSLVVISGQAGVGKSRIAIECYKQFIKTNEVYKPYCIFNQGIDLFEDIKSYFSDSGNFLIFVDDANRISSFQYIVQLLQTKRSDQNFKIIVTVRDYALDKIREICRPVGGSEEITIKRFTDKEIKQFVKDEFEINNHLYLDRISDICQGNPRIAVMAAQIAKDKNTLESIRNVSELYDKYYSSITPDLDDLEDQNILKVAGIVTFFRNVDRTNDNLMSLINEIFSIDAEYFWEASKKLHDIEILDMFENEVVKISDQVLSTYLFYLVFFKEKLIDFSILINNLFPQYKQRLIDAINPVLNTFSYEEIKQDIESKVNNVWEVVRENSENNFLELVDVFWFLKPTDTLIYIKDKISNIKKQDIAIDDIKFDIDANSTSSLPKFLSTLSLFRFLEEEQIRVSLDLLLQYSEKQPNDTQEILNYFTNRYGFQPESYRYYYHVQQAVVDKVLEYSCSGSHEYFTRMFIALANNYLRTHFSSSRSGRDHTITLTQFDLTPSETLFNLREKILKALFNLYEDKRYQQFILKLLLSHSSSGYYISVSSIIENDSKLILRFFKNTLDSDVLFHCVVVQKYLRLLKRFNIQVEEELITRFQSPDYKLYDLITNRLERAELKLSHDNYEEYKKKKITKLTYSYSEKDYEDLLHRFHEILQKLENHSRWEIEQGIISILEELSKRDSELFHNVIRKYLIQGEYLQINPWVIVFNMLLSCKAAEVFEIINSAEYPSKNCWLFSYYQNISSDDIKQEHANELYKLYEQSEIQYFVSNIDYFLKYEDIEKGFVTNVVKIILERESSTSRVARTLSLMFNPNTNLHKNLNTLFSSNFTLLEKAYIAVDEVEQHTDYDGTTFSILLDNDYKFIERYLNEKIDKKNHFHPYDESRDYSFVWLRNDYIEIMHHFTSFIFGKKDKGLYDDYYKVFFNKNEKPQTDSSIIEKQNSFLLKEIKTKFDKKDYMRFLFNVIVDFPHIRKLMFYETFLNKNKKFEDFENLPYEAFISVYSGSTVPILQNKIDFYEKIIQLCNSVELLKHRQYMEQRIQRIRIEIQHEKKRDFTEKF